MTKLYRIALLLCLFISPVAFAQNMTVLGHLNYTQDLNDIWGHEDTTGVEYALVGVRNGFSIVSLANPSNPTEIQFIPGPSSTWRDIKTWKGYAYVTNETSQGLLIVDMRGLPATAGNLPFKYFDDASKFTSAHNIFIDSSGYAYLFGANFGNGGALIYDLNVDPWNPTLAGVFDDYYFHDGMVQGDTLWGSAVYAGFFSKVDVSNKANPVALGTHPTPNNFTHNAWISDDSKTLYTTDEVSGAYIGSYDVTDINNVSELDRWQSSPGQGVIPHNTHFLNDYLITSYYTDGIIVHDVTYPYNIIQTGRYDSSPFDGNGFNGSWGAYPYLPSGLVLNADIEQGLDVLNVSYTRAAYLEGTVTDASNSAPLSEVNIVELSGEFIDSTNLTGFYATGTVNAGSYDVVFSKLGYIPDTVNVSITNGVLTTVNVALVPDVPVTISGTILDASTSMGLANAEVKVSGNGETRLVQTDATGNFTVTNVFSGNYDVIAGQWGYTTECNSFLVNASSAPITLSLDPEYGDDFVFDYGWTVLGNATTGHWERGVPVGTSLSGIDYNPGEDVSTDCGEQAFVTGNGGGGAGDDDVDGGSTHLLSPQMDLSNYVDPYVEYHRWFANGGGATTANDSLIIYLSDGSTTKRIDFALSTTNPLWRPKSFRVKDFFPSPTSTMSIMVTCQDNSPGHLSEGGFDRFRVRENGGVSVEDEITLDLAIYPNPSSQGFSINNEIQLDGLSVMVIAIDGKLAYHAAMISHYVQPNVAAGTYLVQLLDANGNTIAKQTWIKE